MLVERLEMTKQPESRISRAIQKLIKDKGGFAFKVWGSEFMLAGLPDIIAVYRGVFVAFEVKTPVGQVSKRQWYVMRAIKRAGGVVAVPRSVADALNVLAGIDAWAAGVAHVTDDLSAGLRLEDLDG